MLRAVVRAGGSNPARVSVRAPRPGVQAVLLDIEGTTTPITFVSDTLFPYARRHLREHLARHLDSPEYAALLDQLRESHAADAATAEPPTSEAVAAAGTQTLVMSLWKVPGEPTRELIEDS